MTDAISVVVPVYRSAPVVGETIARVVATCARAGWRFEVIAVDDASGDGTLAVVEACAAAHPAVRVIAHARNEGQHRALLTGLRAARGDIVVCMDDDLQHLPEAIPSLIHEVEAGHDVVFARFAAPTHAGWRSPGSALVRWMDVAVFGAPHGLAVSSFRALRRDVVDRVAAYDGPVPYVRGQMLLASRAPADVDVPHAPRPRGATSYTPTALAAVVLRVALEWSRLPAWMALVSSIAWLTAAAVTWPLGGPTGPALLALVHAAALLALAAVGFRRRLPQEPGIARREATREGADELWRRVQQSEAVRTGRVGGSKTGAARGELSRQPAETSGRDEGAQAGAGKADEQQHGEGDGRATRRRA